MFRLTPLNILLLSLCMSLTGCGGSDGNQNTLNSPAPSLPDSGSSGSDDTGTGNQNNNNGNNDNSGNNDGSIGDTPDDDSPLADQTFATPVSTSRFLQQATFGARPEDLTSLTGKSASDWFTAQLQLSPSLIMPVVSEFTPPPTAEDDFNALYIESTSVAFWRNAIAGEDQLRQRMAFALSEILVVSNAGGEELTDIPEAVASYQDILIQHAFGNYRELLEAVTYSPAMGFYLTYMGNLKGDEVTGRMPDENYARELLQLFTVGIVALNQDGTPQQDQSGAIKELYTNQDITGLARVFTGLDMDYETSEETEVNEFALPMAVYPQNHSEKSKRFLGTTIAAGTGPKASVTQALDHIFAHPNVPPFVSKQLIQRLVMSNPSPDYVARVASAFGSGRATLPDGTTVGDGRRGDLTATLAAILFDSEARADAGVHGGKIREPILRFTQWARAFAIKNITPEYQEMLWDTRDASMLGQHPYRSPSVFNFFRPGYTAPGSVSASNGMVAPELQITNASTITGYANFMTYYITGLQQEVDVEDLQAVYDEENIPLNAENAVESFLASYDAEQALASDPDALINRLDLLLCAGQLSATSKQQIKQILQTVAQNDEAEPVRLVHLAILLVMTSPDYLVQK
ncbi:DUF1800 domain-containing protein [Pseudoalteromonas rubra]|uniref:DUF1800 domain-containing protein n=1 Tax=Pseudoalteromonas rubra TaxID=43658 RepID=A0A5S3X3E8_9GAMM|nr:DUF1800 domain-containing protein [Pseudoalteromonas rubra]TMP38154.1 DUF1800 domain-containing protein [Pseudoalteromonas rubra]